MGACLFCTTYKDLPFTFGGILYEDDFVYADPSVKGYKKIFR